MASRKPISKKTRFKIFERDNFTCVYCGKNPQDHDIVLNIDHVISIKDGGTNKEENLVTSCWDCNIGKGKKSIIKNIPIEKKLKDDLERTKERLEQIKMINRYNKEKDELQKKITIEEFKYIEDVLFEYSDELILKVIECAKIQKKKGVKKEFISESINATLKKFSDEEEFRISDFIKYLNGCIRVKVREDGDEVFKRTREELKKFYSHWNYLKGGSVKYYLINRLTDIFNHGWSYEDIEKYIKESIDTNKYNPSTIMDDLLRDDKLFYNQDQDG